MINTDAAFRFTFGVAKIKSKANYKSKKKDTIRNLEFCLRSCCCLAEVGTGQHVALCGPRCEEGEFLFLF